MVTKYRVVPFVFCYSRFATDLNYWINFNSLTVADVAAAAEVSPACVSDFLTGRHYNFEIKSLLGICNALDLDPRDYWELEG